MEGRRQRLRPRDRGRAGVDLELRLEREHRPDEPRADDEVREGRRQVLRAEGDRAGLGEGAGEGPHGGARRAEVDRRPVAGIADRGRWLAGHGLGDEGRAQRLAVERSGLRRRDRRRGGRDERGRGDSRREEEAAGEVSVHRSCPFVCVC